MRYRCLLVDDSARFVRSARRLLGREGVDVVAVAATRAEAITAAGAAAVDFSLIDVQLAGDNGAAVADALARRGVGGRIVLVSALDAEDVAELVAGSAAVGFVAKAHLSRAAIERVLAGRPD
ncbi:response regulator [Mangrovihabitans endophyticus]|uniref:Response regulator n=1 Tax=Mangrovihabitans endophyticus TaxID=1751298 RepID=A0A8J3FKD3_9ACTN|nr:response regulator [Mangrovihabitans endophyticus]GGK72330.1 response regulator [Mangrovihabitans endophyticus]